MTVTILADPPSPVGGLTVFLYATALATCEGAAA